MPRKKEEHVYQPSILTWRQNQNPETEETHYSFPKGTPIWRKNHSYHVNAESDFVAIKIPGEKIKRYSAFKLIKMLKVSYRRGWEPPKYFYIKTDEKLGLSTTSEGYKPTEIKKNVQ
jgi:hypothetical protein